MLVIVSVVDFCIIFRGRKMHSQPIRVFEGSGKVGAAGSADSSPKPAGSPLHGAA